MRPPARTVICRFARMQEIQIRGASIRLGQLLKLADVIDTGAEGKDLLAQGTVLVNGEVETRRGRQLGHGDLISADGRELRVVGPALPSELA